MALDTGVHEGKHRAAGRQIHCPEEFGSGVEIETKDVVVTPPCSWGAEPQDLSAPDPSSAGPVFAGTAPSCQGNFFRCSAGLLGLQSLRGAAWGSGGGQAVHSPPSPPSAPRSLQHGAGEQRQESMLIGNAGPCTDAGTWAESGPASPGRDASGIHLPFPPAPQGVRIHKTEQGLCN